MGASPNPTPAPGSLTRKEGIELKERPITDADKALDFEELGVPLIQIGGFWLTHCAHGGLWLATDGGEGMQMDGATLKAFESHIQRFWKENF
jgi:hypothetical protein